VQLYKDANVPETPTLQIRDASDNAYDNYYVSHPSVFDGYWNFDTQYLAPAAPTGTVSISGNLGSGHPMTALLAGDWAANPSAFTYRWYKDDVEIYGERGATYTPSTAEIGSSIKVRAAYIDPVSGKTSNATSTPVVVVNGGPLGALNISGTPAIDQTLTVDKQFTDAEGVDEATLVYEWFRNGVSLQTGETYTTVLGDVEQDIHVTATYTDNLGQEHSISSAPVTILNSGPVGSVTVSGLYVYGQTLTATVNVTDAEGIDGALSYQWTRNGADIPGATALSYTLGDADVNQNVAMEVRYTDVTGKAEALSSAASFVVGRSPVVDNPIEDQEVFEGLDFSFTVPANTFSDPDGDPFTYAAALADDSDLPIWLSFAAASQAFSGTAPTDTGGVSYDVKVTVDDTFYQVSDTFALGVRPRVVESFEFDSADRWPDSLPEAEPEPGFNYSSATSSFDSASGWPAPPTINGSDTLSVLENTASALATYTEAEGRTVTWSLLGTDAALFAISAAGELSFLSAPDFENPLDAATNNGYQLSVVAEDDFGNASTKPVTITVTDVDEVPPTISGDAAPGTTEGGTEVATYNADEPVVAWTLAGADAAFFDISTAGVVTFKTAPEFDASDADGNNVYEITVQAEDAAGNIGQKAVSVTVADAVFTSTGLVLHLDAGDTSSYPGSGTTWTDLSASANAVTLANNVTYSADGGGSLFLDGTGDFLRRSTFNNTPQSNLTMLFWVKYSEPGVIAMQGRNVNDADTEWMLSITAEGKLQFWDYASGFGFDHVVSNTALTPNEWHLVGFSKNGTAGKYYLDGVPDGTATSNGNKTYSSNDFVLGIDYRGYPNNNALSGLRGKIAKALIYNTTLSDNQVLGNYYSDLGRFSNDYAIVTGRRVAHFDARNPASNPGTGSTWIDLTGNADFALSNASFQEEGGVPFADFTNASSSASRSLPSGIPENEATFSCWVKFYKSATAEDQVVFMSGASGATPTDTQDKMFLYRRSSDGKIAGGWITSGEQDYVLSDDGVPLDRWVNLSFRYAVSGSVQLFVDGKAQATADVFTGNSPSTHVQSLYLGQSVAGTASLDGEIGEFLIYDKALPDIDIQQNYESQREAYSSTVLDGLVGLLDASYSESIVNNKWYDLRKEDSEYATTHNGVALLSEYGGGFRLDGVDDFINTSSQYHSTMLPNIGNMTFETTLEWTDQVSDVFAAGTGSMLTGLTSLKVVASTTYIRVDLHKPQGLGGSWKNGTPVPAVFALNQVYKISVVNEGTVWYFYSNGAYLGSYDHGYLANATDSERFAMFRNHVQNVGNAGRVYDCTVYNRALTAAEILQNFNATKSRFGL